MTARRMPPVGAELSSRELAVLRYMAANLSYPAIGRAMYLSHETVKTYGTRLFRKLGVSSRVEAVLAGIRLGLLPCPCGKEVAA